LDKSVLYIGSLAAWCNSLRRFKALKSICPGADAIDTDPFLLPRYISGMQHHLNAGPGIFLLNRKIRDAVRKKNYDMVLVDNKPYLSKKTLLYLKIKNPAIKIADVLTDDPFGKFTKSWRLLKRTVPFYDIFFVQRKVNIDEFKKRKANHVAICYRSFDPEYNRPLLLDKADQKKYHTPVGFVGTYEDERAAYISYLIQQNIPVSITGNDWPGGKYWNIIQPFYKGPSVYGEEYIKTINGMDIALHFLRHANRDEQDSRTFELPACKVFMIAERSDLHLQLFRENEEAVFFSTKEELLHKVKLYMNDPQERYLVAERGYQRCLESGYDHRTRMLQVLVSIFNAAEL
jgi:hypothetical protein